MVCPSALDNDFFLKETSWQMFLLLFFIKINGTKEPKGALEDAAGHKGLLVCISNKAEAGISNS